MRESGEIDCQTKDTTYPSCVMNAAGGYACSKEATYGKRGGAGNAIRHALTVEYTVQELCLVVLWGTNTSGQRSENP